MAMTRIMWTLRRYRRDDVPHVVAWATVNGLDASCIPISSPIVTTTDTLTVKLFLIHGGKRAMRAELQPGDLVLHQGVNYLTVQRTVPLVEPPPEELFEPTQLADDVLVDWGT